MSDQSAYDWQAQADYAAMARRDQPDANLDTYWLNVKHERNILRGDKWTISFEIDDRNWADFLAGELMKHTPEEGYRNLPEAILSKLLAYAKEGKFGIILSQPVS